MAANQANVALLTQDPGLVPQTVTTLAGGGPTSQRPANPAQWFHYFDTDLNKEVIWNGLVWLVSSGGPTGAVGPIGPQGPAALAGPTSMRPPSPVPFQRYYDTDINCEIWFERGAWRTVAGTVGDIKVVQAGNLSAALTNNPGWVQETNFQPNRQQTIFIPPEETEQLVSFTGPSGQWFSFDLTSQLNALGLNSATAAILMLKAEVPQTSFGNGFAYFDTIVSIASQSLGGGISTPISAQAEAGRDDSASAGGDKTLGFVPLLDGKTFFYSLKAQNTSSPRGFIWLHGVTFNPLVDPTSITDFALRKT